MAVLTLETDYKSEKGYPLDNSRHTDNTSSFENGTVLILDEIFFFRFNFIRQLLTDFEDGLSVSIGVKWEKGGRNKNRALLLHHSCGARDFESEDSGSNTPVGPSIRDKE